MGLKYKIWFYRDDELQNEIRYLSHSTVEKVKEVLLENEIYAEGEIQNIERIL